MLPFNIDISKLSSVENPWGPSKSTPNSLKFNGVPYAPFIKSDKLGKIADWQSAKEEEQNFKANNNLQRKRDLYHAYGASAAKMFGAEVEEKGFSTVDSNATTSNNSNKQAVLKGGRKLQYQNQQGAKKASDSLSSKKKVVSNPSTAKKQPTAQKSRWNTPAGKWNSSKWNNEEAKTGEASITVDESWKSVAEIEFNRLTKLNLDIPKPETLSTNGKIHQYLKKYESNSVIPLEHSMKIKNNQSSSNDPNLQEYSRQNAAKVFITDEILSQLMCAPKSSASWDVIVTKKDGKIFFDKRENTFEIPINENSPLQDLKESDINSSANALLESVETSDAFVSGSLSKMSVTYDGKSPIVASSAIEKGYKYIKYELPNGASADDDKGTIPLIVRAHLDAYTATSTQYVSLHSLLQTQSNDWRTKFQGGSQGNIFADEIKKNNNKISQWATQSVIGGVNTMKIGFIARENPKSNANHFVAGTMTFGVSILCQQLNVSINNGWGIVKSFIDIIEHEGGDEDYKFVIFKTPQAQKIIIYKVPLDGSNA